ncbi:MAG: GAF domain-containing protein, partial [Thermoleophilia bacterium]|nr:GAF domain-containing protein [Thermoleophilia bacterium]
MDEPNEHLDRLANLAARVVGAPVGIVTLVDVDHAFFVGMEAPDGTPRTVELTHSYCKHVVLDAAPVMIEDARVDLRFSDNLAIRDFGVVAYLGVPVRDLQGLVLGSLCVMDVEAHAWRDEDVALLEDIALAVVAEIEMQALLTERDVALQHQTDARERVELERGRYMLLTRIGDITSTIDDPTMLTRLIAQAVVPDTCDWCVIELAPTTESRSPTTGIGASTDALRSQIEELRGAARSWPGWRSPTLLAYEHRAPFLLPNADLADFVGAEHLKEVPPRLAQLVELTGLRVISAVPLAARGRIIGAMSFIRRSAARGFDEPEQALHHEIARRAALAIDGARMRIDLEQRAQAALAIETIGEGVVLLDDAGTVQLWNPAMAEITGISARDACGRAC